MDQEGPDQEGMVAVKEGLGVMGEVEGGRGRKLSDAIPVQRESPNALMRSI